MSTCARCGTLTRLAVCPSCLLKDDPSDLFAGLEIGEELGRGGMGRVYSARDPRLNRTVALKVLADELVQDADMRARFEREAQTLARLHHPNIVGLLSGGDEDGQPYLVMELAPGKPLSALTPMSAKDAIRVAVQVCRALAHAHAQGVIHRDIKPSNILVDEDGSAKVTDFGIARMVSAAGGNTLTAPRNVVGTPEYMAPETYTQANPDVRMDIYALGVVLREMLLGSPAPNDKDPRLGALGGIIRKATAPETDRRYASASELLDALDRVQAGQDPSFPPDERLWMQAVAVLHAVAIALVCWAGLVCLTPRVMPEAELIPLTMRVMTRLPDGRAVTAVRFETGPILGAVAALGIALAAYGLLRRHWRYEGWDRPEPRRRLRESRHVFILGVVIFLSYSPRLFWRVDATGRLTPFMPLFGGLFLLYGLWLFCFAMLEANRRARALWREPLLLVGAFLIFLPPTVEFLRYLAAWHP